MPSHHQGRQALDRSKGLHHCHLSAPERCLRVSVVDAIEQPEWLVGPILWLFASLAALHGLPGQCTLLQN